MQPQFTYDKAGNKVGVFLHIEEWLQITNLYPEVLDLPTQVQLDIADWQKALGTAELEKVQNGSAPLHEWESLEHSFTL